MKYLYDYSRYNENSKVGHNKVGILPTYSECVEMCSPESSPFYEIKLILDGYKISLFNYRLASSSDFTKSKSKEMRGLTFVFN
jgi:hypothetical protein